MKHDNNVLDLLVARWFKNCKNNIVNEEFLFATNPTIFKDSDMAKTHYEFLNVSIFIKSGYVIPDNKNYILIYDLELVTNEKKIQEVFVKLCKYKLLFIPQGYNLARGISSVQNENISNYLSDDEIVLYYFKKSNPVEIVYYIKQNNNLTAEFIVEYILRISSLYGDSPRYSLLLDGTSYGLEELHTILMSDIALLQMNQFLTSRFAVILYRAATLNIKASTTEVGRYFHKCLHQKSQTLNFKLLHKINRSKHPVFIPDIRHKNFKAYDLLMSPEQIIKTDIAKKLLHYKDKTLDIETIAIVTDLSVHEMEALQNKISMRS